eukprot:TRINITY_DN5725_c0_g1_i1.p4 TRINITY_DN5725_c0_g1~~TRINITY_DN5725_c0_g1_i1.p4  ORF type:complete len:53 (-),score=14.06 TRINITY_DN5725_c0_g1_i1:41-199(-)
MGVTADELLAGLIVDAALDMASASFFALPVSVPFQMSPAALPAHSLLYAEST